MVIYGDIKTLPVPSRAGSRYAIFFVDAAFTFIFVYFIKAKSAAHAAADRFIVNTGVHKLPYKCTILTDGCGSFRGVDGNFAKACRAHGVDHSEIPPYTPALNPAEKAIQDVDSMGRPALIDSHLDDEYLMVRVMEAYSWAAYPRNRMSVRRHNAR